MKSEDQIKAEIDTLERMHIHIDREDEGDREALASIAGHIWALQWVLELEETE